MALPSALACAGVCPATRVGTLTPLLKRLEQLGLVQRRRSSSDERELCLALTAAGEALRARVLPLKQRLLCESGVDMNELEGLRHSLGQLLARVTAHS